jgi:hypothetical protein
MKMPRQTIFRPPHWLVLLSALLTMAQTPTVAALNSKQPTPVVQTQSAVSGVPYQSNNRRDPFFVPIQMNNNKSAKIVDEEEPRGTPPPGIAGMFIAQVSLLGVSTQSGGKIAIFRGSDKRSYFLKQGDKLFDGYLKQIGADYVNLVRETKMKSGKLISQDMTKRLRTP